MSAGLAGIVGLAPTQALAAGECGAAAGGAVTCAPGTYPNGITYPTATPLTVTLAQTPTTAVNTTTGGITIIDGVSGDALVLNRSFSGTPAAGSTAPSIVNLTGTAVSVIGAGPATVDLSDPTTDTGIVVNGSANGIAVSSTSATAPVSVTLTDGTVSGGGGSGILANANGGALTINTGGAAINGTNGGITATQFGVGGGLTVTSAGPVTATNGGGVTATISNFGSFAPVLVNVSGLITASGNGVTASNVGSGSVTVNQTAGDIEAQGDGINATAVGSGAVNVTQSGTIGAAAPVGVGTPGNGITANSGSGAITVTAHSINVGNEGVAANSGSGNIVINTTAGGLVQAQGDAIQAATGGSGSVTVNVHGNVTGDTNAGGFGAGLELSTNAGAIIVNTDAGTTIQGLASPNDIHAVSTSGNITIVSNSTLISPSGTAINVTTGGSGVINVSSNGAISAHIDGIDATSNLTGTGAVAVTNVGGIGTPGAHLGGNGILAEILNPASTANVVVVSSGSVYANGTYGVAGVNMGLGGASVRTGNGIAGSPLIIDPASYGVYSVSAGGPAVANVGNYNSYVVGVPGTAGSAGVFALSGAPADVASVPSVTVITGTNDVFTVVGNDARGISATNNNGIAGTGSVTVTTGANQAITVSGSRDIGVLGQSLGLGNVSVTTGSGTIVVNEAGVIGAGLTPRQTGIDVESGGGNVSLVNGSTVTVTGSLTDPSTGILAATTGAGTVTATSNGAVTSNNGSGIVGVTSTGALSITANGAVTTPGLATSTTVGISATSNSGPVSVTVGTGGVTGGFGVLASSNGAVSVANSGAIQGTNTTIGDAVDVVSGGAATVVNHTGGVLTAAAPTALSATVLVNGAGPVLINNAGLITTGQTGHNGYAIDDVGAGATTITNGAAGTIDGRVAVANGGANFNNAGVWSTNGTSTFGLGTYTLNNSGTLNAGLTGTNATPAASLSTTTFMGLTTLNNSGLISMTNGLAGDALVTTGTYAGTGGAALAIDVQAAPTPIADHLTAGGAIGGSTAVTIVPIGGPGLVNGAVIAHGGVGSSPTAFTVATGSTNQGFIHYGVLYNAGTGNYSLFGTPNGAVYETAMIGEVANNLWYKTSDAWSDHMSELRDAHGAGDQTESGLHSWGVFNGGETDRNANRSFTAFGVTSNYNIGYNQNYVGGEAGLDGTSVMGGGAIVYGVSAGYIDSHAYFGGTGDQLDAHSYNLGVYAGWQYGGLFVNGLAKYDSGKTDMRGYYAGYRDGENFNQWGGTVELGYRFGMGSGWFVEPVGSISYVKGDSHDFTANGATFHFNDDDSSRGKLGVRTGTSMDIGWGSKIAPYAHVEAIDEFKGDQSATFTSAGQTVSFGNNAPKTYGEAGVGVDLLARNGFTAFFEGHGDFGDDIHGYGSRIGVRWKW